MKRSNFFAYLYFIGSVLYAVYLFNNNNSGQGLLLLSYLSLLLIPLLVKKIFKIKFNEIILSSYYIFLILASLLGVFMKFYSTVSWYDDFVHFLSGFLTSYLGLLIIRSYKIRNKGLTILFIIVFSLGVAVFWEFFEYTMDILLDKDLQKVAQYGINDTMIDMLMAFAASIVFTIGWLFKAKK